MKKILLAFCLSSIVLADIPEFTKGRWKLSDSGCSNPEYKYSPEELAFIAAIKSGDTVDVYDFADARSGVYETKLQFSVHGYCLGKAKFKVIYPKDGLAEFQFEATEWKPVVVSGDPNVNIKCNEDGPSEAKYYYKWNGEDLYFYVPTDPTCGEYWYLWKKQAT